ncbi:L,D-transpeptidase [Coraliomargarita sinensis]|uniref:L,D-transpeptidase n=1 Tax=Coraliomargarita sinensis TaxID=2174842 RepID=UPI001E41AEFA|nr:L,D-transpeptidase [Coraliomargarita sinensis]
MSTIPTDCRLIVSIKDQRMALIQGNDIAKMYTVSTSRKPPSCIEDSNGTPTGLHKVADKIGNGQPEGMVFKGRVPTGKHFSNYTGQEGDRNLITSRILRLRGLEPGHNAGPGRDSYDRYIYIHGTNHEDRIGQPFSGGCVEMLNDEVIELFNIVDSGDLVWVV